MPIKSFEMISLDAKRFSKLGERPPQLRVEQNATVTSMSVLSTKEAQIDFRFIVSYASLGMINIDGRIVWDGEAGPMVEQWTKTKKLPNDIANIVLGDDIHELHARRGRDLAGHIAPSAHPSAADTGREGEQACRCEGPQVLDGSRLRDPSPGGRSDAEII